MKRPYGIKFRDSNFCSQKFWNFFFSADRKYFRFDSALQNPKLATRLIWKNTIASNHHKGPTARRFDTIFKIVWPIVKFVKIMTQTFLNRESTCDSKDVAASMYDRKTAARTFDTTHGILRSLSLAQTLFKGWNAPIWRIGNGEVKHKLIKALLIWPWNSELFTTSIQKSTIAASPMLCLNILKTLRKLPSLPRGKFKSMKKSDLTTRLVEETCRKSQTPMKGGKCWKDSV